MKTSFRRYYLTRIITGVAVEAIIVKALKVATEAMAVATVIG